ncbi:MAG: hypothetical protein OEM02_10560, partial [Desulfobulbaceae bacterium]|nr:hypothetical protein [Desulfobulbaceae bacterium]
MRWGIGVMIVLVALTFHQQVKGEQLVSKAAMYENIALEVLDISERSYDGGNALAVTLSVPLDPVAEHKGYFYVTKNNSGRADGEWVLSESGTTLYFPYIEPKQKYTVTVYQGLSAINGSVLNKTSVVEVGTRDIQAALTFGGRGLVLPPGHSKGLPVITVNVAEADIEFYRVDDDKLVEFFKSFYGGTARGLYRISHLSEQGTLVYSGRFRLDPPRNKRRTINIPVTDIKELSRPGAYLAVMKQPGTFEYQQESTCFMISDLGLHARTYSSQIDVYVQSLTDSKGLANVPVALLDKKGLIIAQTLTSPQGVAVSTPLP